MMIHDSWTVETVQMQSKLIFQVVLVSFFTFWEEGILLISTLSRLPIEPPHSSSPSKTQASMSSHQS